MHHRDECEMAAIESKVLHECKECGCTIIDDGTGHAEMTKPNGIFQECKTCDAASTKRFEDLGRRTAERINDEFMKILEAI